MVALLIACAVVAALLRPGVGSAARPACAEAVLYDWTRGVLDSSYSPECYEAAIDELPEDLRAYTTAADDIGLAAIAASRGLSSPAADSELSSSRLASQTAGGDSLRSFPTEVALLGAVLVTVVSGGAAAALVRSRRGR